jgi:pimeloyl-ACP methyl ester carboxylesterase
VAACGIGHECRLLNFAYNQVQDPALGLPGSTHAGFTARAAAMWPALSQLLDAYITSKPAGDANRVQHVFMVGGSMGGAVGQLLAYKAQVRAARRGCPSSLPPPTRPRTRSLFTPAQPEGARYCHYSPQQLPSSAGPALPLQGLLNGAGSGVRVDMYAVASPVMGDSVFTQAYNAAVNSRRISFEFDVIAQVPCASSQGKRRAASSGAALPGIPAHPTRLVCRRGMRALQRACSHAHVMRRAVVCP